MTCSWLSHKCRWWHAPFFSPSGYATEAIDFVLVRRCLLHQLAAASCTRRQCCCLCCPTGRAAALGGRPAPVLALLPKRAAVPCCLPGPGPALEGRRLDHAARRPGVRGSVPWLQARERWHGGPRAGSLGRVGLVRKCAQAPVHSARPGPRALRPLHSYSLTPARTHVRLQPRHATCAGQDGDDAGAQEPLQLHRHLPQRAGGLGCASAALQDHAVPAGACGRPALCHWADHV